MPENRLPVDDDAAAATELATSLLLEEYRALRDSVNARSTMRGQLLGFSAAAVAAAVALHAQGWIVVLTLLGVGAVVLLVLGNTNSVHKALMRHLALIESRINDLTKETRRSAAPVMTWHTEFVRAHGYERARRFRDYLP